MTPHFDPRHYYLLKKRVLYEADIKDIVPSDCKCLSLIIFNKLNKRISETTLKRVYGFAFAEFKPSLFTINTLAEYCGYENWHAFQRDVGTNASNLTPDHEQWRQTLERSNEITRTTLQVLKNKCGIPYERTVSRDFMNDHFRAFFKEDATATVLLAPSGYGKTIALCHWVDDFLRLNSFPDQRDVILFFSGSALINAYESGHNLNNWLLALLGLDADNFLNDLFLPASGFDGRFYLIIDGLDEAYYKGHYFANIFEQLNDVIALHNVTGRLKIITTMRSATWCNNEHYIIGQEHWFMGFMVENKRCVNVPLMDRSEICKLTQKLDPSLKDEVSGRAVNALGVPLLLQYYYKSAGGSLQKLVDFDEADEFDLITLYVLNKVYKSRHSMDMITFLRKFLLHVDYQSKSDGVSKLKVLYLIKEYHQAYDELVNIGYLENVDTSHDSQLNNYIVFNSPMWFAYSLADKIYFDNDETFDLKLLETINKSFTEDAQSIIVLKWCVYKTISSGRAIDFNILSGFETTLSNKSDLISFTSKLLLRFTTQDTHMLQNKPEGKVPEYYTN